MTEKKKAEQVAEAIDYKLQGHPYEQIAEQIDVSVEKARELVHTGLLTIARDSWREQLLLDLQRVDQMLTAVYPNASQGDRESINTVMALRRERETIQRQFERQASLELLSVPILNTEVDRADDVPERHGKGRKLRAKTGSVE